MLTQITEVYIYASPDVKELTPTSHESFTSGCLAYYWKWIIRMTISRHHFNGLMQERHNSIANALELCLSSTNPSIYHIELGFILIQYHGCPISWMYLTDKVCASDKIYQLIQLSKQDVCIWSLIKVIPVDLTHWGRVTHICVSKLTIIASDDGLSPGRRQAIIWTSAGILLIGSLGTNFSEILIETTTFSFKKMRLKV